MVVPSQNIRLDIDALSGILGSISIACWIVVFSPQIIENFRRSSADGLSLSFIIIWLLGDVFNILGAVLQGVLPTMTILAVYYTFADVVLLAQCLWYRGWMGNTTKGAKTVGERDREGERIEDGEEARRQRDDERSEEEPLLSRTDSEPRRGSAHAVDVTHLSPATPLLSDAPATAHLMPTSTLQSALFNLAALLVVCAAGVFGWWLSARSQPPHSPHHHHHHHHHHHQGTGNNQSDTTPPPLHFDLWGQIFGYLCAALYLGSRIPQLLLNHRRKSTDGVSILFFLFACVGNLTYVLSILAYAPDCARDSFVVGLARGGGAVGCADGEWARGYARYVLVNASWLVGSAGTLGLDAGIFVQFWWYRGRRAEGGRGE